ALALLNADKSTTLLSGQRPRIIRYELKPNSGAIARQNKPLECPGRHSKRTLGDLCSKRQGVVRDLVRARLAPKLLPHGDLLGIGRRPIDSGSRRVCPLDAEVVPSEDVQSPLRAVSNVPS